MYYLNNCNFTARAQRRELLKRMNPGFTNEQIEAQLIRDDKARAKMAATQSEPVIIQQEQTNTTPPLVNEPKQSLIQKPKPRLLPRQQKRNFNLWSPLTANELKSFGPIFTSKPSQLGPGTSSSLVRQPTISAAGIYTVKLKVVCFLFFPRQKFLTSGSNEMNFIATDSKSRLTFRN